MKIVGTALAYLGLGSNLGKRIKTLEEAVKRLKACKKISVLKKSSYYETEPEGGPPQPRFINGVVEIETTFSPKELLSKVQEIELALGRERKEKWGPRTIDIDILLYDNCTIQEDNLEIPHPMMHRRWFVLEPLSDIASEVVHPVLKKRVSEILSSLEKAKSRSTQNVL